MKDWRNVSSEEFDREREITRRKVFGPNTKVICWDDFHFADPAWRMVPVPCDVVGENCADVSRIGARYVAHRIVAAGEIRLRFGAVRRPVPGPSRRRQDR